VAYTGAMTKRLLTLPALLAFSTLSACTIIPPAPEPLPAVPPASQLPAPPDEPGPAPVEAALGQTVWVDGPRVTPIEVLEDSRCPMNARCIWPGRVRLKVRLDLGSGSEMRDITAGEPTQVADGSLELVSVTPDRVAGAEGANGNDPAAYRFGFRFAGGL